MSVILGLRLGKTIRQFSLASLTEVNLISEEIVEPSNDDESARECYGSIEVDEEILIKHSKADANEQELLQSSMNKILDIGSLEDNEQE